MRASDHNARVLPASSEPQFLFAEDERLQFTSGSLAAFETDLLYVENPKVSLYR